MVEKTSPKAPVKLSRAEWASSTLPWQGGVSGDDLNTDVLILFVTSEEIGAGPSLHVHPYDEVFIVRKGNARFTIGEETIEATEGDVLMGPANVPHAYENLGPGTLETTDIHLSRTWIQTDL